MSAAVAKRLDQIQGAGFKARDVAQILSVRPETVSRWRSGTVDPQGDKLRRLLFLEYLVNELAELFGPDEARLWLFAPHRLLAGETPASRLASGNTEAVLAVLEQLKSGAFG